MWKSYKGPCTCYFCQEGKPHPARHTKWEKRGHLQVAESLDPNDIVWTRICMTCMHEEAP
jgi:hypothetical protein